MGIFLIFSLFALTGECDYYPHCCDEQGQMEMPADVLEFTTSSRIVGEALKDNGNIVFEITWSVRGPTVKRLKRVKLPDRHLVEKSAVEITE